MSYGTVTIDPVTGVATGSGQVKTAYDALVASASFASSIAAGAAGVPAKEQLAELARALIPAAAAPGVIARHDTTHSPVGLWQFDGDLTDSSGNSLTLSVSAGTILYSDIMPGFKAAWFDNATALNRSAAALRITGSMTIECLMILDAGPNGNPWISHGIAGELETQNIIYESAILSGRLPQWFSESGAGVNALSALTTTALPPVHQLFHFAITRSSGTVRHYVNGRALGGGLSHTTPTGGSLGSLVIGSSAAGAVYGAHMFLSSLKIIPSALTLAQIEDEYNLTLGPVYGFI